MLKETADILAIMDLFPATPGHILVLPKRHIETIYTMPEELGAVLIEEAIAISKAVKKKLSPDGLNLVQSNEPAAGQTISHFHLHILPRYQNDSISLRFGHGPVGAKIEDLERIAQLIGSELPSL